MYKHKNKLPRIGDLVMIKISEIIDAGVRVELLEYENIEGMIYMADLSRKTTMKNLIPGKKDVAIVIRMDEEKGYIDLSKKSISEEEKNEVFDTYSKNSICYSIMLSTAMKNSTTPEELYAEFGWALYEKYNNIYSAFILSLDNPHIFDEMIKDENIKADLIENIVDRLKTRIGKISSNVEITCYGYEGIDGVKTAIKYGIENYPVKITLLSSPLYNIQTTQTYENEKEGVEIIKKVLERIKDKIITYGGNLEIKTEPSEEKGN